MQNDHQPIVNVYQALVWPQAHKGDRIISESLAEMIAARVAEFFSRQSAITLADVSCGAGADAYALSTGRFAKLPKQSRLFISDSNAGMVQKAQEFLSNKKDMKIASIDTAQADLLADPNPYPADWHGQVDIALMANTAVLFGAQQLHRALTNVRTLLKKDGILFLDTRNWELLVKNPPGIQEWDNMIDGTTYRIRYDYNMGREADRAHKAKITISVPNNPDMPPAVFTAQYQGLSVENYKAAFAKAGFDLIDQGHDDRGPQLTYNTFALQRCEFAA